MGGDSWLSRDQPIRFGDEDYQALGRYIAEFSQMIRQMRWHMVARLQRPDDPPLLAELAFSGATADPIATAFFAMCQKLYEHDPDEKKTATRLRDVVTDAVKLRNDVAHGDWYVGFWLITPIRQGTTHWEPKPAFGERIKAGRKAGTLAEIREDLNVRAADLERLTLILHNYGSVCFGTDLRREEEEPIRVRDVVTLDGDGVPILGPKSRHHYSY